MYFDQSATERKADVIPVKFWVDSEQDEEGNLVNVDWVKWQKIGNPNHCGENKIEKIKRYETDIWNALEPSYKAFKEKREMAYEGTPIDNWPSCTRAMAEKLQNLGFFTIEAYSKATDADMGRVGMGAMDLRRKAREFIALAGDTAKASAQIVSLKEENRVLKDEIIELKSQLENKPKRRGRPPK